MRKTGFIIAAMAPLLGGCAEFVTVLAGVSDELYAEQGYYYQDEHYSQVAGPNCPGFLEYGRINNQSYQRVRNTGPGPTTFVLRWSSGFESTTYLQPGEASPYFYMTPSVVPDGYSSQCSEQ